MPIVLIKFSKSTKGKFLLLLLTIMVTLYNRVGGMIMAMFYIFLSEINYEFNNATIYEGFADTFNANNNNNNNNKIKKKDKLSIEQELMSRDSATQ